MIKERLNRTDVRNLLKSVEPLDDYSINAVEALLEYEDETQIPYNRVIEYAYNIGADVLECAGVCEIIIPWREPIYISDVGDYALLSELDGAGLYVVPGKITPYTFRDIVNLMTPGVCKLSTYIKRLLNSHSFCSVERTITTAHTFLDSEAAYAFTELAREYYEKEIKPYENN